MISVKNWGNEIKLSALGLLELLRFPIEIAIITCKTLSIRNGLDFAKEVISTIQRAKKEGNTVPAGDDTSIATPENYGKAYVASVNVANFLCVTRPEVVVLPSMSLPAALLTETTPQGRPIIAIAEEIYHRSSVTDLMSLIGHEYSHTKSDRKPDAKAREEYICDAVGAAVVGSDVATVSHEKLTTSWVEGLKSRQNTIGGCKAVDYIIATEDRLAATSSKEENYPTEESRTEAVKRGTYREEALKRISELASEAQRT